MPIKFAKFCITNEFNLLVSGNENTLTLWNLDTYEKIEEVKKFGMSAICFMPE